MVDRRTENASAAEVGRFNSLAHRWWEADGEMRMLHRMNPARMDFIASAIDLGGTRILDIGCGAGILTEALAKLAAQVVGIDLATEALAVARLHAIESGVRNVDYRVASVESIAREAPESFDVVTCMEMLEHVPDPARAISACANIVNQDGDVFFSTIDRTPQAYLSAVIAGEYLFGILPKGTHRFEHFIRPSELARWARQAGMELVRMRGLNYRLLDGTFETGEHRGVNYLAHFRRRRQPS
jgi:2-polyprenyl-6-hydroxyphenyl methylase/3-demethylubiquinone-9 3-methyltransferase